MQLAFNGKLKKARVALWTIQVLLALVFLLAGGMKLVLPLEALRGPVSLPGMFVRFIGVCEVLGAIGLILPTLFRIRPSLTPLAASGLVIIMIGATTITLLGHQVGPAVVPAVIGLLAATVAYGRWRVVPVSPTVRALPVASSPLARRARAA